MKEYKGNNFKIITDVKIIKLYEKESKILKKKVLRRRKRFAKI